MTDSEISRELNSISTLNGWGIIGLLVPIIGLVCYGVSYNRANKLILFMSDKQRDQYGGIVQGRKTFSTIMSMVCALVLVFWAITFVNAIVA